MALRPLTNPRKSASQERSRATVDALVEATARILVKEGFDKASTNRIAEKAGVSVGSIYQYFDSKDDLFDALMSSEGYALRTHVAMAIAATGQRADRSWEPLRAAVQATFEFFEKDKATAKLLLRDAYALRERIETHSTTSTIGSSTTSTST